MKPAAAHTMRPAASSRVRSATPTTPNPCLNAIRHGDPAAAPLLYRMYADTVRLYLRRHAAVQDVEETVFSVLLEAVRYARESGLTTLDDITQVIHELSQQGVFALRRRSAHQDHKVLSKMPIDSRRDLISGVFSILEPAEREILLRSSLLSEKPAEISTGLAIPIRQINKTRAKARFLMRLSSQVGFEHEPAATA